MIPVAEFVERRNALKKQMTGGLVLLLGHSDSPMNYRSNCYPFRQDSTFRYYFGLNQANLAGVIDIDTGTDTLFGDDVTVDDIIWTGRVPTLAERCSNTGVTQIKPLKDLAHCLETAQKKGQTIHILPQFRARQSLTLQALLGLNADEIQTITSEELIRAVVAQRSYKSDNEICEIEKALTVSREQHHTAMRLCEPGKMEREVLGDVQALALRKGYRQSFPDIFSVHGEILHNVSQENQMQAGDIIVYDSGVEIDSGYTSDISRTIPVSGTFTQKQKDVYQIVLNAYHAALDGIKPGVENRTLHKMASKEIICGLKSLGIVKGNPDDALAEDVHTLFFQCGLGHMMGLDIHDMENLGEQFVGYTDTIKQSTKFGWRSLRLGRALEPGFVMTVEPGIYFIPELIDRWKADNKLSDFIDYNVLESYRDFGGTRVEDDVVVTDTGYRKLGDPIALSIDEVEHMCRQ